MTARAGPDRPGRVRLSCTVYRALMHAVVREQLQRCPEFLPGSVFRGGCHRLRPKLRHAVKRAAARSRDLAASTSRSFGGAEVTSWFSRRIEMSATSVTARSKASALTCDGFVQPLIFRTYWSAALCTSSCVAGGSKLYSGRMLRHIPT